MNRSQNLVLLTFLFLIFGSDAYAQLAFSSGDRYQIGVSPQSVAVADLDANGSPDIVFANYVSGWLTILTNNGKGDFTFSTNIIVSSPTAVVASDVNRDGRIDLICANVGNDAVTILTNAGNARFVSAGMPAVGHHPGALIAVDVNNDGNPDLVTANSNGSTVGNTLSVLTNDGNGHFVMASSPEGLSFAVAAADVNEDGRMDLISAGSGYVNVLTNSSSGTFALSSSPYAPGAQGVVTADVNGDGHIDLITSDLSNDKISILTNDGTGKFALASSPSVLGGPYCLEAADINGDGKPDLVVGTVFGNIYTDTGLTVLTNDGVGSFTIATKLSVAGPKAVTIADVNADGKADLVVAETGLNRAAVLFQVPQLSFVPKPDSVLVSWPASWTNWILQANCNLSTSNWVTRNGASNDGTNKTIAEPLSVTNHFFRLVPATTQ